MKNIIKRSLALVLLFGFVFNTQLLNEIKEVKADWVDIKTYNLYFQKFYSGGVPNIFQIVEEKDNEGHAPYHYLTRSKTTSSKVNHNVHRTIALQVSRIKSDVDPFMNPYYNFRKQGDPFDSSDPHYYIEVDKKNTYYNEPWEAITVNGKTYSRQYFTIPLDSAGASETGVISVTNEKEDGFTINDWIISYDTLWNQIQYSYGVEGWYEELKQKEANNEPYYFGVDAVKTWVHLGSNAKTTSDDTIHAKYTIVTILPIFFLYY